MSWAPRGGAKVSVRKAGRANAAIDGLTPPRWKSSPIKPGDILLAYFPYREAPGIPAPQYHPVLVIAVDRRTDPQKLFVAYGTSVAPSSSEAWRFRIPPEGDFASQKRANRTKPTWFDLNRTALLHYNEAWFACAGTKLYPRMGELDAAGRAVFDSARSAFEATFGRSLIPGKPALSASNATPDPTPCPLKPKVLGNDQD